MKELIEIQKNLKAPKGQYNNFGKYKYRSCEDILEALKPLLSENKCYIVLTDDVVQVGDRYYIKATATITNSEGKSVSNTGWAREDFDKKGMDGSQITGTASSYARKYALNGLFAIDDTQDADLLNKHNAVDYAQKLRDCKSMAELKTTWDSIPVRAPYQAIKDEMKLKLSTSNKNGTTKNS